MFLLVQPTQAALQDTSSCPCPNQDDPVAILSCVLDAPADNSQRGLEHCMAQPQHGYPPHRQYGIDQPNIYRSYRIVSVSDGKPYQGQATKRINMEFDFVARMDERSPQGHKLCRVLPRIVTAYLSENGWLIEEPLGNLMSFKLGALLANNRSAMDKRYIEGQISSVSEISKKILSLKSAAEHCPRPVKNGWQ